MLRSRYGMFWKLTHQLGTQMSHQCQMNTTWEANTAFKSVSAICKDKFTFWNWPMLEKLSIFFQIDAKLNEKVMHSRMLQLFAFDWNAWMGSRMDHFAEIDKNQKQTLNTGTSLIYAVCIDAIEFQLFEGSEHHNKSN